VYPVQLKGLDPAAMYQLKELSMYPGTKSVIDAGKRYSGEFLMNIGFNPEVSGSRTSVVLKLEKVK
jgi:alpha-galactosidase